MRLNIQIKFVLITGVLIILVMGVIGYLTIKRDKDILIKETVKQGKLLAETLAIPIINDMVYEKLGLIEEGGLLDYYITEIYNKKEINLVYIMILDKDGKVISHSDVKEYGKFFNDPISIRAIHSDNTRIQKFFDTKIRHHIIDVATPLIISGERWGTLRLGISLEKLEHKISSTMINIIILTVLLLTGGFITIFFITRHFIKPISILANTMEEVGKGNLDVKVNIQRSDEFGILCKQFNKMIENLKKAQDNIIYTEKMASIGKLASGIAHEINNPLGGMLNCIYMLNKEGSANKRDKYLNLLREGLEQIGETIRKLLTFAQSGNMDVKMEFKDINKIIEEVIPLIEYRLRKNRIKLNLNLSKEMVPILLDITGIKQVLVNIILNAIDAMPQGGNLTISTKKEEEYLIISISDTGYGIPEEDLKRIFEPFFTTKPLGKGTGLGLSVSYGIIKNHRGDIIVKSRIGVGSTFIIRIPYKNNNREVA
jgi:signal transduction histidine kinase